MGIKTFCIFACLFNFASICTSLIGHEYVSSCRHGVKPPTLTALCTSLTSVHYIQIESTLECKFKKDIFWCSFIHDKHASIVVLSEDSTPITSTTPTETTLTPAIPPTNGNPSVIFQINQRSHRIGGGESRGRVKRGKERRGG